MSELSLPTNSSHYDFMVNINPSLVQRASSPLEMRTSSAVSTFEDTVQHQQQYAYQGYAFQPMPLVYPPVYPVSRFAQSTYYDPQRLVYHHPDSPDSISSRSSPPTPPSSSTTAANVTQQQQQSIAIIRPSTSTSSTSSSSSSISTNHSMAIDDKSTAPSPMIDSMIPSSFSNTTSARVKETIARANAVPLEFYQTEFFEYSKETYERKMDAKRNKRKRLSRSTSSRSAIKEKDDIKNDSNKRTKKQQQVTDESDVAEEDDDDDDLDDEVTNLANAQGAYNIELRRQIHIQSEQKRRAQIKDGFEELRKHLPGCSNKKMSKAALLTRTVQQLQHMKVMQTELLCEVERLMQENDELKKFQHGVLQRQAMEKMYHL